MRQINSHSAQILSAQLVGPDELKEAKKNAVESAKTDGQSNIVLVEDIGEGESIVSNIAVEDIQDFQVGQETTVGTASGRVIFVDGAADDASQKPTIALEKKETTSKVVKTAPVQEIEKKESSHALTPQKAYKFGQIYINGHRFNLHADDIKQNIESARNEQLTPREYKANTVKLQEWVNFEKKAYERFSRQPEGTRLDTDGDFGEKTFLAFKEHYQNFRAYRFDEYVSNAEFQELVDDAIQVFDKTMSAGEFTQKWHFPE